MTALPRSTPVKFIEQHAGVDAVPIEKIVMATDQHLYLQRDRQLDRLTRPQVTDDFLLFTEEVAPVDRQDRYINLLIFERSKYFRNEDCITRMVERYAVA